MYYVYVIENLVSGSYYVGYTVDFEQRWRSHLSSLRSNKKTKLYDNIRKYGAENFEMLLLQRFIDKQQALDYEEEQINLSDSLCLNLAPGGEGGFVVQNKDEWQKKLSKARAGRKPAQGMRHTDESKLKSSVASKTYWASQETYNPQEVQKYTFSEAKELFGISKTHYYRLLRRAKGNDLG